MSNFTRNIFVGILIGALIVFIITAIVNGRKNEIGQNGHTITKRNNSLRNANVCQPCSIELIEKRIGELVATVQKGEKARTGRTSNSADACRRVQCNDIVHICETKDKYEAKLLEAFANRIMKEIYTDVCGNIAPDARGNQTKLNVPEVIYFKKFPEDPSKQRV